MISAAILYKFVLNLKLYLSVSIIYENCLLHLFFFHRSRDVSSDITSSNSNSQSSSNKNSNSNSQSNRELPDQKEHHIDVQIASKEQINRKII